MMSAQALCQHPPFLPRPSDSHLQLASSQQAAALDRHFRLLREDFVGPLRAELKQLGFADHLPVEGDHSNGLAQGNHLPTTTATAGSSGVVSRQWLTSSATASRNVYTSPLILGVCMKPRPCVMISIAMPPRHRASRCKSHDERLEYWKAYGHSTLPLDALVCLASPGSPLVFATVVRRDPEEMACVHPIIGVSFEPGQDTEAVLQRMGQGVLPNTVLVQVRRTHMMIPLNYELYDNIIMHCQCSQ